MGMTMEKSPAWLCIKSPVQFCKAYTREVDDGHLTVFVGMEPSGKNGESLWHLSISHRSSKLVTAGGHPLPGRIPTWEEISQARYKFVPDEVNMAMMLPPKRLYINVHPTCMHLHQIPVELAAQDMELV